MTPQPRKMSEILKEMSERLLRNPGGVPSSEAVGVHSLRRVKRLRWNAILSC
jgi:hypothetical protein